MSSVCIMLYVCMYVYMYVYVCMLSFLKIVESAIAGIAEKLQTAALKGTACMCLFVYVYMYRIYFKS